MNQKSLKWGIGITVIWLSVIIIFWIFGGLTSPKSLNELGDFLAGIFAPVAFLWLILGYVQQGKQLEQNTKALEQQERALQLQIDEMRNSLEEQKELTRLQKLRFDIDVNNSQPKVLALPVSIKKLDTSIILSESTAVLYIINLILKNVGLGAAIDVSILIDDMCLDFSHNGESEHSFIPKLNPDDKIEVGFVINENHLDLLNPNQHLCFTISCKDVNLRSYNLNYYLHINYIDQPEKIEMEIFSSESITD